MIQSSRRGVRMAVACLGVVAATCIPVAAHAQQIFPLALVGLGAPDGERVFLHTQTVECVVEFVCSNAGCWQAACINGPQTVPALGTRMLTYYEPSAQRDHLFFLTSDRHVHEWSWPDTPALASNVVDVDLTQQSNSEPAAGNFVSGFPGGALQDPGSLTGYVDGRNVEHVFYVDDNNDLDELYHNSNGWFTGHTVAFPVDSRNGQQLASMWDGTCQHIFYVDQSDAFLWEDYACGSWQSHALTGPNGAISPLIGITTAPSIHLAATFVSGNTEELWGVRTDLMGIGVAYCASFQCWGDVTLSSPEIDTDTPVAMAGPGNPVYGGSEGDIFTPNDPNQNGQSLQSLYGNDSLMRTSGGTQLSELAAFVDVGGTAHIFYVGGFGDLFEFYQPPGQITWTPNQLTSGWEIE